MTDCQMLKDDDRAECVVCWTETEKRCSPCGDPVCANCGCPNGCEKSIDEPTYRWPAMAAYAA